MAMRIMGRDCGTAPPTARLIIAIEQEGGSHWIAAHGWWLADVQTYGRWIEWSDWGLHADDPVAETRLDPGPSHTSPLMDP